LGNFVISEAWEHEFYLDATCMITPAALSRQLPNYPFTQLPNSSSVLVAERSLKTCDLNDVSFIEFALAGDDVSIDLEGNLLF
jgi:hypothetical protein